MLYFSYLKNAIFNLRLTSVKALIENAAYENSLSTINVILLRADWLIFHVGSCGMW